MRIYEITCNWNKAGSIEKHTHAYTCPLKKTETKSFNGEQTVLLSKILEEF